MVQNVQTNSNIFSSFPDYSSLNQSYSAVAASSVESIKTPVVSIDKVELEASQKKKNSFWFNFSINDFDSRSS